MQVGINPEKLKTLIKYKTTDSSNFDKRCSDDHFVPFLFYQRLWFLRRPQKLRNLHCQFDVYLESAKSMVKIL